MQEYKVTVDTTGTIRFYKPGTVDLHRTDGPAVENVHGSKYWYQNDKLHRLDGPAVERADGSVAYWIDGKRLSEEQFKKATAPVKEMTIAEIEAILGHSVKIVK